MGVSFLIVHKIFNLLVGFFFFSFLRIWLVRHGYTRNIFCFRGRIVSKFKTIGMFGEFDAFDTFGSC